MLIIILILAFILRIYQLGQKSFWYDEACSLQFACRELTSIFHNHYLIRPVYFFFINIWTHIFGIGEYISRLPSVLFGVLAVFYIFKLGKELFGYRTGLITAFLLAVSYFHIAWSQEVRGYVLLVLFSIIANLYFFRIIYQGKFINYVYYAVFTLLTIFTCPSAILMYVFQIIYIAFLYYKKIDVKRWLVAVVFVGLFVMILLWVAWFMKHYFVEDMVAAKTFMPGLDGIRQLLSKFNYGGGYIAQGASTKYVGSELWPYRWGLSLLLILFYIYGVFAKGGWNRNVLYCLGLFWSSVLVLIVGGLFGVNFFAPKYLLFVLPVYYLLIARGMAAVKSKHVLGVVVGLVIVCNMFSYRDYYHYENYLSWREAAAYLRGNIGETDTIVIIPAQATAPFWLYYKKDLNDLALTANGLSGRVKWVQGEWRSDFIDNRNRVYTVGLDGVEQFIQGFQTNSSNIWVVSSKYWPGLNNYERFIAFLSSQYELTGKKEFSFEGVEVLSFRRDVKK